MVTQPVLTLVTEMNGKTHLIFGILTAGTLVLTKTEMPEASDAIFVAGSALGSLLPDIDTTKSTIGTVLFPISFFVEKLGHRTYTHDIVLWSLISVFILMRYPMLSGVVFGYMGRFIYKHRYPVAVFFPPEESKGTGQTAYLFKPYIR